MDAMRDNPLLDFSGLPRFDAISPEHIGPAIDALLAQAEAAVKAAEAVVPVTWEGFVAPLEDATERLWRAWGQVGHLQAVVNTPQLRQAYNDNLPRVTRFGSALGQNLALFAQYRALAASPEFAGSDPVRRKVVDNALRDFRLGGAELDEAAKARFSAVQEELAALSAKFSQNVLDATDAFALYLEDEARLSGLPVGRLICASNANNVLTDFFNTAVYDKNRPFLSTTSPSMDILVSSNLERLVYLALNRDAAAVRERMEQLRNQGRYALPEEAMARIRACFTGVCASDQEGMDAIARVYREHGYLMDPHTAVAWRGMEKAGTGSAPCVVLSTASPCKFPACVLTALGQSVPQDAQAQLDALTSLGAPLPRALDGMLQRPVRFSDVIDPQDMMAYVQRKAASK